ncbi:DEAD/DEAH box helicase [Actinomadura sp. LD22]|uniref:DEAD/DEAH box helicase n=2 Tax=Actinomadura physcomitrii TaxID=2650748 RepID=A0A6I4MS81_9ACTN|nr:DEAD/DEAH box helicase [Actinomadura physcomitrii]MWA05589.1 DEAD/DEAH box helicase [Actinomadura physcomitrii]
MHHAGRPAARGGSSRSRSTGRRRPAQATKAAKTASARRDAEFALPETRTPPLPPVAAFAELPMPPRLLAALAAQGVTDPFPIQAATLPDAIAGRDVLGRGRTGSGKTLAFGLALLTRTAGRRAAPRAPLALVLVPTRELAQQVTDALAPYADAVGLRTATVVGGMSLSRQAGALGRGVDVLIATPGRLADLVERGDCRLGEVRTTVLDEADQMTDMGFLPQVTRLLELTPGDGQRMLFSATLDRNIDRLVRGFLDDPVTHSVDPSAGAVTAMEHHVLHIADTDKLDTTVHIAARDGRVIMFVGKKHGADRLVRKLAARGVRAAALHGGKSQSQRNRALENFHNEDITVLVATNVAARGIHIDDLDLVVNVDLPADHKDYLHRGGRTARAGRPGTVVTLVLPEQRREMADLMAKAGITPRVTEVRPGDVELARITGARTPPAEPAAQGTAPAKAARSASSDAASGQSPRRRGGGTGDARRKTTGTPATDTASGRNSRRRADAQRTNAQDTRAASAEGAGGQRGRRGAAPQRKPRRQVSSLNT